MKHIKTYESHRIARRKSEIIKEAVMEVNDIYKVKALIDIPKSLINSYVKKVKDKTGNNLRQFFGDVDIAEEIVKHITMNNLDIDKLPSNALIGGAQTQVQSQGQTQTQGQAQTQTQVQTQAQTQVQTQAQDEPSSDDMQVQTQGEDSQAQDNVQVQTQVQTQTLEEDDFEDPINKTQEEEEEDDSIQIQSQEEEEDDFEEELPL